jgi:hypothetical protein
MMCEASYYPVIDITYSWLHSQFPVEFYRLKTDGSSKVWIERDKYYMMVGDKMLTYLFVTDECVGVYEALLKIKCLSAYTDDCLCAI